MTEPFKAACIQPNCGNDIEANFDQVSGLIRAARAAGAAFIATPEVSNLVVRGRRTILDHAEDADEGYSVLGYRRLAAELQIWLLVGSLCVRLPDGERAANRSYLINSAGDIVATYDKIHMFDVDLPNGESYRESRTFKPGDRAVTAATPWGVFGITICYDIRFPGLYRDLAHAGAGFLTIPAAFTRPTGRAHWHVLQRARAIENGCYVFAPAQCGEHPGDRKTYGHSVIIDPWGEVVADAGDEPGYICADINPAAVGKARAMIASLQHDRDYQKPARTEPATAAE